MQTWVQSPQHHALRVNGTLSLTQEGKGRAYHLKKAYHFKRISPSKRDLYS